MKSNCKPKVAFFIVVCCAFCLCLGACSSNASNTSSTGESASTPTNESTADSPKPSQDSTSASTATPGSTSKQESASDATVAAAASVDDPYTSDEACLSCHGGSYEALAKTTDHYGDSNPHAGTHGNSALSCDHCHTDGKTVPTDENNMCLNCHAWPRDDQSYLEYMDLD